MKHYVLTRCAYGPRYPVPFNRRRLEIMAGITALSMRSQTTRDVTWLVLIDPHDPLLAARRKVIEAAGLPSIIAPAGKLERVGIHDRPYGPWAEHIDFSEQTLTTRLDDDDALASYALERVQAAAAQAPEETAVWTLPTGFRIVGRNAYRIEWDLAQFGTLAVPPGVERTIFDVSHQLAGDLGPLRSATDEVAWLWVRHRMTRSRVQVGRQTMLNGRSESGPCRLTPSEVAAFQIDWRLAASLM